ncbi:cell envelope integrity protein TolA [Mangrovibrevibacter kandeliae]|uniref:cell envelope integrity protein TolA n=1 Tax=Mangrovibrevibacter kandeliae TaxID=2968473 RepID=UPI00211813EE|nr:cell envelope integrity protein TolA [Aurantimonas sp. CSK15Z-1]MCQ8784238.1 hypothetical protein [Aurantimonas sp. CSK15Z-1]
MKPSIAASAVLHAALLSWGLWSFSSPTAFDVSNAEALPVEIVPIEDLAQSLVGDDKAKLSDKPAPKPTEKPAKLPMPAEHVGDNEVDLDSPPKPQPKPRAVEQAAAQKQTQKAPDPQVAAKDAPPPPPPPPTPKAEPPKPEPAKPEPPQPQVAETPQPPEPKPEVDAVEQTIAAAAEDAPAVAPVPRNVPLPQVKPQPPKPEVKVAEAKPVETKPQDKPAETRPADTPAKTDQAKPAEKKAASKETKKSEKNTETESEFNADDIAALLNKEKAAGGGAKRSTQQASLGGERNTGTKLSQSELGELQGLIKKKMKECWAAPYGVDSTESLRVSIHMRLDPSGALEGVPSIVDGGSGSTTARAAGDAALRAVRRCAPYNLPTDKYDAWSELTLNFDPSAMY